MTPDIISTIQMLRDARERESQDVRRVLLGNIDKLISAHRGAAFFDGFLHGVTHGLSGYSAITQDMIMGQYGLDGSGANSESLSAPALVPTKVGPRRRRAKGYNESVIFSIVAVHHMTGVRIPAIREYARVMLNNELADSSARKALQDLQNKSLVKEIDGAWFPTERITQMESPDADTSGPDPHDVFD